MIVFAILGLLIGLLFMFVRQKLSALESRVNLLTDTVQTMAGFRRVEDEDDEEEDEEEDEEDEDDEDEDDEEIQSEPIFVEVNEPFTKQIVSDDEEEVKMIILDKEPEEIKTISLDNDYESLSLKELKDKVTERGGPKLRTKKELLDFLKNIM